MFNIRVQRCNWKKGDTVTRVVRNKDNGINHYEFGIAKLVGKDVSFVVYNCSGEWVDYMNYTAAGTHNDELIAGWKHMTHHTRFTACLDVEDIKLMNGLEERANNYAASI